MGNNREQLDALWGNTSWKPGSKNTSGSSYVDESYVDQFIADANSYMDTLDEIINGISYRTAKGTSYAQTRITEDLQDRAKNVLNYLDENQDKYDVAAYRNLRSKIEGFQNTAERGRKAAQDARDFYSQWDTEEAYNKAMQESSWAQKYQGKGYQDLVPLLEGMEDSEEKSWLTEYAKAVDYDEHMNMDLDAAAREIQDMNTLLKNARMLELEYNSFRENPLLMMTQSENWNNLESRYDDFTETYGSLEKLQQNIEKKRQRMADAKALQDSVRAEQEYDAWTRNVRDADSIQKDLDALNAQIAPIEKQLKGQEETLRRSSAGADLSAGGDALQTGMAVSGQMKDASQTRKTLHGLEQQRAALEQELLYRQKLDYAELMQRPDFAENSRYIPTGNGNAIRDIATGTYVDTGFRDIEYDFINKNEKAKNYQFTMDSLSNMNRMGMDRSWLLQLKDEEVAVYNYLYHTQGKEAASRYLDVMRSELNQRQRTAEQTKWAEKARANPVAASLASVAIAPMKAAGFVGQAIDYATDGRIDPNAAYNRASHVSAAIRDEVSQIAQEKWGSVGSFGYQTAMSMGDFLINGLAGGGFFGVPGVTMAIMGSGAAADTVISAKKRGLSDAQSFGLGAVAGLAEALTERFSLEALLDADLLRNGIGVYMLKNSLTEGSEEVASSIINLAADILVSKEKSEWKESIRSYETRGYTKDEAFAKAMAEQAAKMGLDFAGGFLSGGVMSGATSAQYKASTSRTGRALGRQGLTDAQEVQKILDAGANAGKGSAANAVAGRLQKKIDAGQKLSAFDKGELYQSNPEMVGEAVFGRGSVQLANPTVRGIDSKHEDWEQAQRLSSITGRDIRFYNGDPKEDGYYNRKTGEIFINVDRASEHQAAYVFSHELTHSTELGESYKDLRNYIKGKLIADGRDWDLMMREKAKAYADAGHALESNADIESEIVAQYVQDNLLSNEQELFDLFWAEPTLAQKILNWFDKVIAKYGKNDNAKERVFAMEARQRVLRAWESANQKRQANRQQPRQEVPRPQTTTAQTTDYDRQSIDREYEEGRLTDEEYDQMLDALEHDAEAELGGEEQGRQYSFAGKSARTADLGKLEQAKKLQKEGVSNETIRQETGWFQGMDGKWRFEIDDSQMRYHRSGDARFSEMHEDYVRHKELTQRYIDGDLSQQEVDELEALDEIWGREQNRLSQRVNRGDAQLQHILRHDALFEAYPELREVKVRFEDMGPRDMGSYYPYNNLIILNSSLRNSPEKTILHEVQHAIQNAEGYAKGSSPDYWHRKLTEGEEPKTVGVTNALMRLQEFEADPSNSEAMHLIRQIKNAYEEETLETVDELEQEAERKGLTDKLRQYEELEYAYYGEHSKAYDMVPSELYQNTAGEIEARDTANRWNRGLDAAGRKNTSPDLGDDRTVFAEGNTKSFSIIDIEGEKDNYGTGVLLDTNIFDGVRTRDWGTVLSQFVYQNLAGAELTMYDDYGNAETVYLAKETDRVLKDGAKNSHKVLDKLAGYRGNGVRAKAIVQLSEVLMTSRYENSTDEHSHQWMDEKGWIFRKTYLQTMDGNIYEATLNIADGRDHKTLYEVNRVHWIDKKETSASIPSTDISQRSRYQGHEMGGTQSEVIDNNLPDNTSDVKRQYSINGQTVKKRDVARDLRAILSRGGDPKELQRYVSQLERNSTGAEQNGKNRYQTDGNRYQRGGNRNSTAQQILQEAHSQGQSVEEYLRWNPEQFERDGKWRPEALEAMRMEQGEGRQYSLNEDAGQQESAESQAHGIQRENLPTKAQSYLARAESRLLNTIGDALSVPRYARYNSLRNIIQEISNAYLEEGMIRDEKMDELFDKAYAEGIVADAEFYNQYKEVKDHLRTYGVTISDRDKSDIPDFNDFRKRAFGTVRILNEGGVPVDVAYQELRNMAPELFPDDITHPADQLVRMYDVGQSIAISEKSLHEYYGHSEEERKEFRRWARNDFDSAIADAIRDLRQVKRYAEDRADEPEVRKILTTEEAEAAFQELKKLRRDVDKARAKNLLTESDEILLGRILKGEIGLQHLNPNEDNVKGITAIYEAKLTYESQVEVLAAYKRSVRAKRLQDADRFLETAGKWKDKRAGILYARETMRRNIMDIVPDKALAREIAEHYFEAVHISEAQATKFRNDYRDRVRKLNLSRKVMKGNMISEAHAVQLLGEAMDNIRVMENARGRMGMRDGKTLAEWRAVVDDLWMNNTGLDRQKVERAVEEFRKIYDDLFQQMNRIRVENGYEPVNYRQGYFPHFQPGGDGIMGFFGKVMGINTQVDALPTSINGLTHTFKPGIQWFGNAQERIGFNTAYDAVEGFDKYIEGVASVIYQTENIQNLRALATQARYRTSDEGIRKQVDAVRMDDRLTEEEKQREINSIYEHGRFSLSNFVAELDEYTNLLANKKSKYDRTMEALIGRQAYTMMKAWENRIGANMIAGNISSALTNFIPLTQAGAQLDSTMILKGMWETLRNMKHGDGIVGMSDFLTNRRGSDPLVQNWMQKTSGILGTPMELIDNFTSESIVRAAYLQNLKRGLSEAEAMHQADIFAAGVMADRSKGAMPTLFESRNPLFKAFTQFQLEVNNQFSEVFKDLPRNHREKGLAVLALILLKYFLGAWLYNELFEKVIGRRSALDPIGILMEAGEDLTGYEIPNLLDMIRGEKIEKTGEGSIGDAGANLASNVLSELPFSAGLNLFGVETDGGRLPAASAVPDLSSVWDAATQKELTGDQRWKMIQDELNKLAYVLPPFGGGQIGKSYKGIKAYLEGGSYSLDKEGNEILQYPVYKDDPDDAFWSLVRAAFLGKNSLEEAQDWVNAGYDSFNQYETVVYKDLLANGVQDRDAYSLVDQLRKVKEEESETGARRAQQRKILEASDISREGKATAFYGMVATNTEQEWMDKLVNAGADEADTMDFVSRLYDVDKLRGMDKKQEQYALFLDAPLAEEEKKVAVGFIMSTDLETDSGNPTQYAKFLSALETGLSVDKYMEIRATDTDIEDYLELTDMGIRGDKAADLAIEMDSLEPEDGYNSVTWIQRCRTIMDSDLSETEQMAALEAVMYESTYEKVKAGHNFGMNVKSYIDLKSIMPQFDANGNGSYSQQETEEAINALSGDDNVLFALTGTTPNGYTLTDKEKAILWQLQNKSWKPNRNPFDREVGQMVYDYLTAEDSDDADTMAGTGSTFDVSGLLALMK